MGIGVWGKAETLKSPALEAGVRNFGMPVVGWGGAFKSVSGRLKPREGELQEGRCQLDLTEGKLSLGEGLCLPCCPLPLWYPPWG